MAGLVLLFTAVALLVPSAALACSCGGQASSSNGLAGADVVFLGVVAPKTDWTRADVVFDVVRTFKGPANDRVAVARGESSSCGIAFSPGERWLVYARAGAGRLNAEKCARTRLEADAGQDLLYFEGLAQGRPQGLVVGNVFRRSRDARGERQLVADPRERFVVVVIMDGRRVEVQTDPGGAFQLTLPPGAFELWAEQNGTPLSPRGTVHFVEGKDRLASIVLDGQP